MLCLRPTRNSQGNIMRRWIG